MDVLMNLRAPDSQGLCRKNTAAAGPARLAGAGSASGSGPQVVTARLMETYAAMSTDQRVRWTFEKVKAMVCMKLHEISCSKLEDILGAPSGPARKTRG